MGTALFAWTLVLATCTVVWRAVRAIRQRERALSSADDATRLASDAFRASESRLTALLQQLPIGSASSDPMAGGSSKIPSSTVMWASGCLRWSPTRPAGGKHGPRRAIHCP